MQVLLGIISCSYLYYKSKSAMESCVCDKSSIGGRLSGQIVRNRPQSPRAVFGLPEYIQGELVLLAGSRVVSV